MSGNLRGALAPAWHRRVSLPARTPGIFPLDPVDRRYRDRRLQFIHDGGADNESEAVRTILSGLNDNFSRVIGDHSLKAGFEASYEQVNVNPNPIFNGSFLFQGQETGFDFADFLIGSPSFYNQPDSQAYYIRHRYQAASCRIAGALTPNLTFNYGVRWDHMEYWSEKYNQIPTYMLGEQSVVYPNAPAGPRLSRRSRRSRTRWYRRETAFRRASASPGRPAAKAGLLTKSPADPEKPAFARATASSNP